MTGPDRLTQRRFGGLLLPVARAYRRHLDLGLATLSLSHSMALAVMLIGRAEAGLRQGALADQLGMEPSSVVPIIDNGERAGLIERRVDANDKRARTLHLTTAGCELAVLTEQRSADIRAELFQQIAPADLATALSVLERLAGAIDAADRG